ncbi:M48 family metalloprotease [Adhaeribacter pallidiroseus]|uniref:Beta-barrel assembly-enhancing protease n=1 Tax=Adhaeribacter pallidiroseus TaxID=2072847 RepID=A0A369QD92_9BACT|nr:M48 family metalloprotease [Adhaeribacter pallidiroseus]RDC62664.1 Beta-barrel assembly-enhancing protease [Adhaeribacter pallidiroseus]
MTKLITKSKLGLLVCTAVFVCNSCATNPVTGKRDISFVSKQQEIAMGQQADPEVISQFGLYPNEALQRFINQKGQQMVAVSHRKDLKYEFKIVDSPVINAFAVPGGYVYFTRGIMAHFNNEAQFAGVLGHEIGHIAARHSARQQSKSMLAQLGLVVGMVVSPELAQFGDAAQQSLALLFLKFGRDDERESDRLGVEYSTKIGYDANYMADFFRTLQRQQEQSEAEPIPDFLSTHPNPADRYETVKELAADWQQKTKATNLQVNRNSFLKLIDGIVYGEDPRQGFVEANVFYHPELKFQFPVPTGWAYQNSPQQFQMAEKEGKAMMALTLVPGKTLEEAAQQMLQKYQLQVVENQKITVNGLPALAIVADQKPQEDPQQQQQQQQQTPAVRTLTYLFQYNSNIYSLMGISLEANFNTYFATFQNTMQRFRALTDPALLNRQAERVRVKTIAKTTTLAQALRQYHVTDKRLTEMAILNGMELNDQVTAGSLIKVVQK